MRRVPTEMSEQIVVVKSLRQAGILFCAVPNGGRRDRREAILLKASGTVAGVPDILIFDETPAGDHVGTALEMKRIDGKASNVTKHQRYWMLELEKRNWLCLVGFGASDALTKLRQAGYEVRL
jgi:hypothetical protein